MTSPIGKWQTRSPNFCDHRTGVGFAQLAKQYSNASNAQVGGEFGWLSRGTLTPDIDSVALALAVGETSQVIDGKGCAILAQRLE